jgi:hypothetical protein
MYEKILVAGRFGLSRDQMRGNVMIQNGGWFNVKGELLGFGDLAPNDLVHIAEGLEEGELFVVLYESSWRFQLPGNLERDAPGVEYVAAKCSHIIARSRYYHVESYVGENEGVETFLCRGLILTSMPRVVAKVLIADGR